MLDAREETIRKLCLLGERMAKVSTMEVEGKRILELARELSKEIRPYDLASLAPSKQYSCYLFRELINDIWRNFGGDSAIGMPIAEQHQLSGLMLSLIASLGRFIEHSLGKALIAEGASHYQSAVSIYISMLHQAEEMLMSEDGGRHA
jgi:hypothetical protein